MADRSKLPGAQLLLALLGGLCAIPAFVFLTSSGARFSFAVVDWKECWLGLPSWLGTPVPLALPIVLSLILAAWGQTNRAANPLQPSTWLLLGLGLLLVVGLIVVAGVVRGVQLLLPLAVLARLLFGLPRIGFLGAGARLVPWRWAVFGFAVGWIVEGPRHALAHVIRGQGEWRPGAVGGWQCLQLLGSLHLSSLCHCSRSGGGFRDRMRFVLREGHGSRSKTPLACLDLGFRLVYRNG